MTPTQRTLKLVRGLGYVADIAEKWNSFSYTRHDLFGFIDIVAIGHGKIIGIQTTSDSHHADHRTKILGNENSLPWAEVPCAEIWLITWKQKGGKGSRWSHREERFVVHEDTLTPEKFTVA